MFARLSNGIALARSSWHVLVTDKHLLVFPAVSGILFLLVVASFVIPLATLGVIALILFGAFLAENPLDVASHGEPRRAAMLGGGRALVRYGGEIALDIVLASVALLEVKLPSPT